MIDNIIRFSLRHRLVVWLGALLVCVGGFLSTRQMDIDVFPDLTAPTVVVMTDCQGMASEEVERLVTFPIETAINGATDVRRVRSASSFGFSFVWVEFDWGADVFRARQVVSEKLVTLSGSLPEGVAPQLAPQSSVMGEILFVGLQTKAKLGSNATAATSQDSARGTTMMELRSLAEWTLKPAILATGGVSQVTIIGGDLKQYQVLVDPARMAAYGVSMDELTDAVRAMSQNSDGGVIRDYGNEYVLRGMGRSADLDELGNTLVKMTNSSSADDATASASLSGSSAIGPVSSPVRLSDVAEVTVGSAPKMGMASIDARPAIILSISKQPSINTLEVTRQIEANLEALRSSLPDDVELSTTVFRQADFIESSVDNVGHALLEGAFFVILVLFLFLGSFRTTVISVTAIPLALLATIVVLYILGMDINTMTLGGMCIAIGSLVDDAIIDVENVYKRLRQGHARGLRDYTRIVFEASSEIRSSVLSATLIVMVAFIPMFFLDGMEGRMLKPLGITYVIALFMSLVVAMTVTPLFCRQLLTKPAYLEQQQKDKRLNSWISGIYEKLLKQCFRHKRSVMGLTFALLVLAVVLLLSFGSSFLPDFNEGALTISAVSKPGVSLDESDRLGQLMERQLLNLPEVTSTSRRTGRGELDEHSQTTNSAEIDVNFTLGERSKDDFMADLRQRLATVPGVAYTIGQPLGHRIDHMLSGTRANIAIKIFGTDLSLLQQTGDRIKAAIEHVEGLVDVSVDQQTATPQLQLRPRRQALAARGITMEQFNHFVATAAGGERVGEIFEGQRSYDLVVRLRPDRSSTIESLKHALVDAADGTKVPLEEVCDIVSTDGPGSISRENVQRKLVVSANVQGRDVGSVVADIKREVDEEVTLPDGFRVEYGGQFESAQSASRTLLITTLGALLVIFLLLYAELRRWSLSAMVMLGLPLALIGGVYAIAATSGVLSIPAIIGFITLFGIATRNGILLISRYQALAHQAEEKDGHGETAHTDAPISADEGENISPSAALRKQIIAGSLDRLNPILMTALTSALALIPLVFSGDKAGNEIQSPMAIVVLGGLLTSTLLNLLVMPLLFEMYAMRHPKFKIRLPKFFVVVLLLSFAAIPAVAQDFSPILRSIEQHSTQLAAQHKAAEARKTGIAADAVVEGPELGFNYLFGNRGIGNRYDIELSQTVDMPAVYKRRKAMRQLATQQADLGYLSARQQLLLQAKNLCIEVVYCNAQIEHLEHDLHRTRELAQAYETLFERGEATALDYNKAHEGMLMFEGQYRAFETMRHNLLAELRRLNGGEEVTIADTLFERPVLPNDFSTWLTQHGATDATLQEADGEIALADKSVTVAKAGWMPRLKVGYTSEFEREDHYQGVSFGLSLPAWGNKRRVKAAQAELEARQLERRNLEEQLVARYEALFNEARQQMQTLSTYDHHLSHCDNSALLLKSLQGGQINLITYLQELQWTHEMHEERMALERDLQLRLAELLAAEL